MPAILNVDHRNAILDATGDQFASGTLQIRTGAPAGVDQPAGGTLLVEINLPASPFGAAANGQIDKAGTWSAQAVESGAPGHFRLISDDGNQIREGTAGDGGSGATMIVSDLEGGEIIQGGTVSVDSYTITQPDGS